MEKLENELQVKLAAAEAHSRDLLHQLANQDTKFEAHSKKVSALAETAARQKLELAKEVEEACTGLKTVQETMNARLSTDMDSRQREQSEVRPTRTRGDES